MFTLINSFIKLCVSTEQSDPKKSSQVSVFFFNASIERNFFVCSVVTQPSHFFFFFTKSVPFLVEILEKVLPRYYFPPSPPPIQ